MQKSVHPTSDLITLSAAEMARHFAAGQVTSRQLVEAHIARIQAVNSQLNAVVIPRFEEALVEASAADAALQRGELLGPLAGVPITVKECFHLQGTCATEGIDRFASEISSCDNPLVARLRRAGAIVLGKTNLPQLMVLHESDNPLYGRTNNPWNLDRGPGGSSGGEAAIIAAGGSPLGLANDIGGSIRQPAHSCGICGLKPTSLRLTNALVRDNLRGMEAIRPQCGPLARSVDDLYLAMRVLTQGEDDQIDWQAVPVPLRDPGNVRIANLRIGFWTYDGFFSASPALRRAVAEAAEALRRQGAVVEAFDPPDAPEAVRLFFNLMTADGAADALRLLGSSRRDWRISRLVGLARQPSLLRGLLSRTLRATGQARAACLLDAIGGCSADRYWQVSAARANYAERFFRKVSEARLDALICPPHSLPSMPHGATGDLSLAASYCYWANVLGIPAGVVPATRVRPNEESDRPASRDTVERAAIAAEARSVGLPIGVQVAARPWREDVVLAVMKALETHFRAQPDFPLTPILPAGYVA
jgi:fatty acid amide hydrolase